MNQFEESIELLPLWNKISADDKTNCCNKIIETVREKGLSIKEIERLAICLAKSGSIWKWTDEIQPTLDICSTGGAGSLTTLLCPYLVATQGIFTPQVSVQGSIAGAIDTLGIIPDFKFRLSWEEMKTSLKSARIGNTLNTYDLAPADLFLFKQRINKNAKDLPDLVIASLLSKKISSGIKNVILDVRVGTLGNFGDSLKEAEYNSKKLVNVGERLGIKCVCILTNHNFSPMPFYGRLESLAVLWYLANRKVLDVWTNEHIETCIEIAAYGVSTIQDMNFTEAIGLIRNSIDSGNFLNTLELNLKSQGSSLISLQEVVEKLEKGNMESIKSSFTGCVESIDFFKIRNIFNRAYGKKNNKLYEFDSPIGLVLKVREGTPVREGDIIMEVRVPSEELSEYVEDIEKIIAISDDAPTHPNERIYKVIKLG